MKQTELKKAFLDTVPVLTGYVVLGIGFGIILKTRGYGVGWALAMSLFIYAGSLLNQLYWVTGSVIGSLLGSVIPFNTEGIDFALTALFVTIFTEQWLTAKDHRPALIGLGASAACLLVFDAGSFLIPAMLVITLLLTGLRSSVEGGRS